eukprot:997130-Pyramimonas_sp.AAC.1
MLRAQGCSAKELSSGVPHSDSGGTKESLTLRLQDITHDTKKVILNLARDSVGHLHRGSNAEGDLSILSQNASNLVRNR